MKYKIEDGVLESLWREVDATSPEEECFILTGKMEGDALVVEQWVRVPNRHEEPEDYYRIVAEDVPEEVRPYIVGCVHTHREGQSMWPSDYDIDLLPPGTVGITIHAPSLATNVYVNDLGIVETYRLDDRTRSLIRAG